MEHGILRVSETAKSEIEAARAFVIVNVASQKVAFGNAALTASEELKHIITQLKQKSEDIEVETESVALETSSGFLGKNSSAHYTLKFTVSDLDLLGEVLGICSEGKNISVQSIRWDYDEDAEKLKLIKQAIRQAQAKAEGMMAEIGHTVLGVRTCSDSYQVPTIHEINVAPAPVAFERTRRAKTASASVDIGTQFKSKKTISATCTVEFFVQNGAQNPNHTAAEQTG
ncbi:MAG: SIMPL domain-containing protein [Cyanobacteria bacterium P01_A01_bin.114]